MEKNQRKKVLKEKQYKEALDPLSLNILEEIKKVIDIIEEQGYLEEEKYWSIPYDKFEKTNISQQEARNIFQFLTNLGILPQTPIPQKEGYIVLEPPVWEEPYASDYDIFQKVLKNTIKTKSQKEKTSILYPQEEKEIKKLPEIFYDSVSGIGYIGEKKFKFKDHQPEYRVFAELYKNINKKVDRYKILVLVGYYEESEIPNSANKSNETYKINEVCKKIRKRTGLNTEQLVNNNGNFTLRTQKSKKTS